jgi:hypothetical protein
MAYLHDKVTTPTVPRLIRQASDSKTSGIRIPPNRVISFMHLIRRLGSQLQLRHIYPRFLQITGELMLFTSYYPCALCLAAQTLNETQVHLLSFIT